MTDGSTSTARYAIVPVTVDDPNIPGWRVPPRHRNNQSLLLFSTGPTMNLLAKAPGRKRAGRTRRSLKLDVWGLFPWVVGVGALFLAFGRARRCRQHAGQSRRG